MSCNVHKNVVYTISIAVTGAGDGLGDGVWLQHMHSLCLSPFQWLQPVSVNGSTGEGALSVPPE